MVFVAVRNLPMSTSPIALGKLFDSVEIEVDRMMIKTVRDSVYVDGFCEFDSREKAEAAVEKLNGKQYGDTNLLAEIIDSNPFA